MKIRAPPVSAPLPCVARNRVETVIVRRKCIHWGRTSVSIVCRIVLRKLSLPDIATMFPVRPQLIAPGICLPYQPASCGILPLRFSGKSLFAPGAERLRIVPGDVDNRIVPTFTNVRPWTFGCIPLCAAHLAPPWRTGDGVLNEFCAALFPNMQPEYEGPAESFSFGLVTGLKNKFGEHGVRYRVTIDQERAKRDVANRSLSVSRKAFRVFRAH